MTTPIREELERAYGDEFWPDGDNFKLDGYDANEIVEKVATWAAKWFGERCAMVLDDGDAIETNDQWKIRQLIQEMGE